MGTEYEVGLPPPPEEDPHPYQVQVVQRKSTPTLEPSYSGLKASLCPGCGNAPEYIQNGTNTRIYCPGINCPAALEGLVRHHRDTHMGFPGMAKAWNALAAEWTADNVRGF